MIVGIGIDLIEIEKIAKDLHSDVYLRKVFTEAEIALCKTSVNSAERFAGRFAAKGSVDESDRQWHSSGRLVHTDRSLES